MKRKKSEKWTGQEDSVLIDLWKNHTAREISHIIGTRSECGVFNRVKKLEIGEHQNDWSANDTETLVSTYKYSSNTEIANSLGRSLESVTRKAQRLGLDKIAKWEFVKITPSLAHLVGVYLTDGCISNRTTRAGTPTSSFLLTSIDKEYIEETILAFTNLCDARTPSITAVTMTEKHKNLPWRTSFSCKHLLEWIEDSTKSKESFPMMMYRATKDSQLAFISAMLDGDGWITKSNESGYKCKKRFNIGFGSEKKWIFEFVSFLYSIGIKTNGQHTRILKSGKEFYDINIDKKSFVSAGGYFRIKRKMNRLFEYVDLMLGKDSQRLCVPPLT